MLDAIIRFSLRNRGLVLIIGLFVLLYGGFNLSQMPVDVFPDLNRPTVTIMTESPGLAPEEVEVLVTRPIEYQLNGATGVKRVRSASGIGLSIVWVEFDWGTDIYRDRQIVAEKIQIVRERLPANVNPVMAPISSIMGEIMLIGLRSDQVPANEMEAEYQRMEIRTLGEFTVRNRLLAVEGVSQVTVMGGTLKQYQVVTSPARLAAQNITLQQLTEATQKANVLAGGGIMVRSPRESLIRISGQSLTLEEIENSPVAWRGQRAILIKEVADVRFAGPVKRGDGSVRVKAEGEIEGGSAIILAIQKQPGEDTLKLEAKIKSVLDVLQADLPDGVVIERRIFNQADFIRAAVDNVTEAVRDGAIWVVIVLFLFMWNFRTSFSSLTAMPLSIFLTFMVFHWFGISINTMTLGGIAVAIGDLVDDSIVDIENIFRRLKENHHLPSDQRRPALDVVYDASREVRNSIVYATLVVVLVVLPLFALSGLEGRMFAPLGLAYMVSLLSSLAVSLTITPVLASYLLPKAKFLNERADPLLLRSLKRLVSRVLQTTLRKANLVLIATMVCVTLSMTTLYWMGGEFLPPFNEGTFTISFQAEPGTSLDESQRLAGRAEEMLLTIPEVVAVSRRTGRAELDEHAEGVNSSEIDVRVIEHHRPKPGLAAAVIRLIPIAHLWGYETQGRPHEEVLADIRDKVTMIPGIKANIGQPISHRLDHIMSGVRAQIAVKVFGSDLRELRDASQDVYTVMSEVPGVVDLQIEPQVEVSQVRLQIRRDDAARYGLSPGDVADLLETAYKGRVLSQILDEDRYFDLIVWYDEASRNDPDVISQTIVETPSGRRVSLGEVVEVLDTTGPTTLNREHIQRRIVVFCNVQGRDLIGVVEDIRSRTLSIAERLRTLPGDYRIEFGGQFEAQRDANFRLLILGSLSVVGVFLLLLKCLRSWRAALQVMVNIPLAAMGSIVTLLIVNQPSWEDLAAASFWQWPSIWIGATTLSVAHWVGFITLIGIVSRNGIMMISHYMHLMEHEGEEFGEAMIIRGSLERLAPVMMTAMTSLFGLLPLLLGAGQTGKEILYPLALVVFGGMLTSTLLDQLVTPALFFRFGRKIK
ncbi:MAG TPA: efflux RND transporter permease subunit [Pirellulaceae bacterium]|nr:efflux RND transporter permease subunit [Pirellulaceae bacterium]HMO93767.1 efflux RND transporter permease subunit [Pirellulaceae bacterium]